MPVSLPQHNIRQCGIQAGQVIADFGAGGGAYALLAAEALMSTGTVYAIDIQEGLLSRLQNMAYEAGLKNIECIVGDIEEIGGTKLADATVDLVLLSNLLFQIDNKKSLLAEAKRVLVPGGRVMVVEWSGSFGGIGPEEKSIFSKENCLEFFEDHGFAKDRDMATGTYQYGFIFKKI